MDLPIVARVYFDRKPPYAEEAALRAAGEKVKVRYELEVERVEAQTKVQETEKKEKIDNNIKKEHDMIFNALSNDKVLEKVSELNRIYPDFVNMSQSKKMQVIADIINGKHDNLIFNKDETHDSSDQPDTKRTDSQDTHKSHAEYTIQSQPSGFSATA